MSTSQQTEPIRQCIFPAAGYGTRFLPVTKSSPKEMLPIINKPLIHYGVEEAYAAGMRNILMIVGRNKEAIVDYFDVNYELEQRIRGTPKEKRLESLRKILRNCVLSYTRQHEMKGLGDAVLTARYHLSDQPFAVCLADDLCLMQQPNLSIEQHGVLSQMQQLYAEHRCSIIAVHEVPQEQVSDYGVVIGKSIGDGLWEVEDLIEKPDPQDVDSNLAVVGRYILTPRIFEYLEKAEIGVGGEVQLTDSLRSLARSERMLAYKIRAKHFDCGNIHQYVDAIAYVNKIRYPTKK